ncbi:MAG: hypothetical protein IJ794_14875 [Lachnospiraceae bacterium]|nr:hypothetical protein [Lachnospiraceae bacterium]
MKKEVMDRRESRVMQKIWEQTDQGKSVSVADLEELFEGEKISKISIFKAVQSLLKKEYIGVAGLELAGTVYARKFEALIKREEYAAIALADDGIRTSSLGSLVLAMIGNDKADRPDEVRDEELIKELEMVIERIRNKQV